MTAMEEAPFCIICDNKMILELGKYVCPECGAMFDDS